MTAIAYALRFNGAGKPHRLASDVVAELAARVLAEHLERAGFVVLRRPPAALHSG